MTRKRAEIKSKKSLKKSFNNNKNKILVFLVFVVIIFVIIAFLYAGYGNSSEAENTDSDNLSDDSQYTDKWLFAMDTDNVQYKYSANAIPTLVIIGTDGNVIFYDQGAHSKEQLTPYIEDAIDEKADSLGKSIDFTVTTFDGKEFTLSKYTGKVVLIDIMGVGCPPCEMQMPELQKIKKEFGGDITILSVDVYYSGETKEDVIDVYGEYIIQ